MGYCPEEDERHQTKQYRPLEAEARCKYYLIYSKRNSMAYCACLAFGGCPLMTPVHPVDVTLKVVVGATSRQGVRLGALGSLGHGWCAS